MTLRSFETILVELSSAPTGKKGGCANKNRKIKIEGFVQLCQNPPHDMTDKPEWVSSIEEELLGVSLTCVPVDGCDTTSCNCTCKEYNEGFLGNNGIIILAGQIESVKETTTKKGKNPGQSMAFVVVGDATGNTDVVMFPDIWYEYKYLLVEGNTIMISGQKSKKGTLSAQKIWQI